MLCYNIFGDYIGYYEYAEYQRVGRRSPKILLNSDGIWPGIIIIGIGIVFLGMVALCHYNAKRCSLSLDEQGINGAFVRFFSGRSVVLPMDKIDSITVQTGILDMFFGGKTIVIRSSSGVIHFPWVQNAQEFVDVTLAEIQKYNETMELKKSAPPSAADPLSDDFEKIRKLKELLDEGLLTQEEYDAKRSMLLYRM